MNEYASGQPSDCARPRPMSTSRSETQSRRSCSAFVAIAGAPAGPVWRRASFVKPRARLGRARVGFDGCARLCVRTPAPRASRDADVPGCPSTAPPGRVPSRDRRRMRSTRGRRGAGSRPPLRGRRAAEGGRGGSSRTRRPPARRTRRSPRSGSRCRRAGGGRGPPRDRPRLSLRRSPSSVEIFCSSQCQSSR